VGAGLEHSTATESGWGSLDRASLIAGVCASTACAPADMVKSRIMHDRDRAHAGGKRLYKNSWDCAVQVCKHTHTHTHIHALVDFGRGARF
jgi:hypothetical protein